MSDKILKLTQAQTLYNDLRGRIDALPTDSDIPEVPVQDVQLGGISILDNGVANIPNATSTTLGVSKIDGVGIRKNAENKLYLYSGNTSDVKNGSYKTVAVTFGTQHESAFYGLAKIAGHDEKNSSLPAGQYTPEAKGAIQSMLGVSDLIAPSENNLVASKAYSIGEVFTANGKLYKATAAIAADAAIIPEVEGEEVAGANCVETSIGEGFPHDVQINGTSILSQGVANIPFAYGTRMGVVVPNEMYGVGTFSAGQLRLYPASLDQIKADSAIGYKPFIASQGQAIVFYNLARVAGDSTQSNSNNAVGTYTDEAKASIRNMLDAASTNVIAVQDTQPTDSDTKLWLPETEDTPVLVPTMDDMNTALAGKVGDVQVNGTSVVSNGVANIPVGDYNNVGVYKVGYGIGTYNYDATCLCVKCAQDNEVKLGTDTYKPIVPGKQHYSTFYGLAKAAGDTTQSASSNAVGTYTDEAKAAIQQMLGIDLASIASQVDIPLVETIDSATPSITGQPNTRYVCGEVTSISITPPAAGSVDVVFTSGSTVAVLTTPNTVKWPDWFDASSLDANTIYEILITDGVYGSVMTWAI